MVERRWFSFGMLVSGSVYISHKLSLTTRTRMPQEFSKSFVMGYIVHLIKPTDPNLLPALPTRHPSSPYKSKNQGTIGCTPNRVPMVFGFSWESWGLLYTTHRYPLQRALQQWPSLMRWVEVVGLLIRSLHLDLQSRLLCMISGCVPCEHTRSTLVCWTAPLVSLSWNLVMSALVLSASSHCLDRCHCLSQLYSWRRCYVTPWPAWHGLKQLSVVALPLGYSELLLFWGISHSGAHIGIPSTSLPIPGKKGQKLGWVR